MKPLNKGQQRQLLLLLLRALLLPLLLPLLADLLLPLLGHLCKKVMLICLP